MLINKILFIHLLIFSISFSQLVSFKHLLYKNVRVLYLLNNVPDSASIDSIINLSVLSFNKKPKEIRFSATEISLTINQLISDSLTILKGSSVFDTTNPQMWPPFNRKPKPIKVGRYLTYGNIWKQYSWQFINDKDTIHFDLVGKVPYATISLALKNLFSGNYTKKDTKLMFSISDLKRIQRIEYVPPNFHIIIGNGDTNDMTLTISTGTPTTLLSCYKPF